MEYPLSQEAQKLASAGRFGDTMLVHMNPAEVAGLASLPGGLTINPDTGQPEAFLQFLLPLLGSVGATALAPTLGITSALGTAALGGLGSAVGTVAGGGNLQQGLLSGLLGFGLGGLGNGGFKGLFGGADPTITLPSGGAADAITSATGSLPGATPLTIPAGSVPAQSAGAAGITVSPSGAITPIIPTPPPTAPGPFSSLKNFGKAAIQMENIAPALYSGSLPKSVKSVDEEEYEMPPANYPQFIREGMAPSTPGAPAFGGEEMLIREVPNPIYSDDPYDRYPKNPIAISGYRGFEDGGEVQTITAYDPMSYISDVDMNAIPSVDVTSMSTNSIGIPTGEIGKTYSYERQPVTSYGLGGLGRGITLPDGQQIDLRTLNPYTGHAGRGFSGFEEGGMVKDDPAYKNYAAGGQVPADYAAGGQVAADNQANKMIEQGAVAALTGQHPEPEKALALYQQAFGQEALQGLMTAVRQQMEGRLVEGAGAGQDDAIPAMIDGQEPAALSSGEFVVPADVVSHLGDGDTGEGADRLQQMMAQIRQQKTGKKSQPKKIDPQQVMPG